MGVKNMTIVYDAKSESVVLLKDRVVEAKDATDKLNKSFQDTNKSAQAGFIATGVTIGDLKGELGALQAKIEQTDKADKARLDSLRAQYKEIQNAIKGQNDELEKTRLANENISKSFNGLFTTIKAVITAGIIKETIAANLEMAKLAGQIQGVKSAFDRLPNSVLLLEDLRRATHGTLDDLTLMTNAVKASNFHIPLEQMGKLLEFVSIKAQQTGLDIDYLTNSLINGLARNSPRLLEHLGFSIAEIREATKQYGETSTAVYHLIDENLKIVGSYIDTSATKVDQLSTSWKNLKQEISTSANETGFLGTFISILDAAVMGVRNMFVTDAQVGQKAATDYARGFIEAHKDNEQAIKDEIKLIDQRGAKESLEILILKDRQAELAKLSVRSPNQQKELEAIPKQIENLETFNALNRETVKILTEYITQLDKKKKPDEEQLGLIEAIDQQIKQLNEDLVKTRSPQNIIDIQLRIKTLESEKANLLDPDKYKRELQQTADEVNQDIRTAMVGNSEEILKGVNKQVDDYNKQLVKDNQKDFKQFIAGLKLQHKEQEQEESDHQARMQRLMRFAGQQLFTTTRQVVNQIIDANLAKYDEDIQNLQDYYSNQEQLAGNNQKAVQRFQTEEKKKEDQLQREKKAAQKKANIEKIEIDTAANVIRSILENGGIPYGLPFGAIAAAMGLVQIALVNQYAEGVIDLKGPGTATSDSIPSMLSRGESVMTAEETRNSGNILRSIRAKKLNDQVLEKLTITTEGIVANLDDRRIVSAIERNKNPDYARQFSVLYETKEARRNMKRVIRSKSFNN